MLAGSVLLALAALVVAAASARFSAARVGHVGSRGEWLRLTGVVENNSFRLVSGFADLSDLAQAVQFEVIKPLSLHPSAG